MSFLRHDEIYRSDVGIKTILSLQPSTASRWSAPSHDKGRGFGSAPFPSSAMSLESAIPWQVALQQSPPPLHRPESILNPPAETVNHHLARGGENSTGDLGNFQPALTHRSVARHCQFRRAEGPQAFEDSRHIATLRKTAVPPLSL